VHAGGLSKIRADPSPAIVEKIAGFSRIFYQASFNMGDKIVWTA
jgi:hypothetical protein